ncbi:hypothetical protein P153DRAFT_336945 [Dothidotthia symphoricarpi CBS 119687]|uniref:GET complex, subunit GET2 n=1 Tax=Dothidotthia symphoricarpi CBS 119687 TaxID=1392245 RepID=A0A6A6AJ29_9PLEO|nr:uncharacterized protein P153DRAFT_336945 [Dothidotthia symphoricarpi CBS 119687]KAF2130917.1 hypothetical protein P153DRAFT_336945 [Dothidotthia symphoricarpi CBS 119687]
MEDPTAPTTGEVPGESPAQKQSRLRRERRAAKLTTGGASRLQQITALQGGPPRDLSELQKDVPVKPSPGPTPAMSGTATPDPDEIDISQHHYAPASQPRLPSPFAFEGNASDPFSQGQAGDASQDPMMAMLQQMMGGGGGIPGFPGGSGGPAGGQPGMPPGMPPGMADMFAAMQGGSAAEPSPTQSSAWIWRLVHSLFSLAFATYIVLRTPFSGSKQSRDLVVADDWTVESTPANSFAHFFYLFATFEVVMQSSRYFVEKGQLQGSGILSTVAGILPAPYGGYVRTIGRYGVIWSTVVSDAMVVVFILGATTWWKGAALS